MAVFLAACNTLRETQPPRTATEQLLLSTAADEAVTKLQFPLPKGEKVFLDTKYFDTGVPEAKYAISAIQSRLLEEGYRLAADRNSADLIMEIRLGALSINKLQRRWLGIPEVTIPIPFASPLTTPEINLIKQTQQEGIAKIGVTFYDAKDGSRHGTTDPVYGFSHLNHWLVLLISWTNSDLIPDSAKD